MALKYGGTEVINGEVFALVGKTNEAGNWTAAWRVPLGRVEPGAGAYVTFNRGNIPIAWGNYAHCVEALANEFRAYWEWHNGRVRPVWRRYPGWRRIIRGA